MSGDYEVGYCRPPKATRYKKGKSGNPRGRPREADNPRTVMYKALTRRVRIQENGRHRRVTLVEAAVMGICKQATNGNPRAFTAIVDLAERFAPEPWEQRETAVYTKEDEDLERYVTEGIVPKSDVDRDEQMILPYEDLGGTAKAAHPPPQ